MQESKFIHGYDMRYTDECLHEVYENRLKPVEFKKDKLRIFNIKGGYILPLKSSPDVSKSMFGVGGIANAEQEIYFEASMPINRVSIGYPFEKKDVINDERKVIYAGIFFPHWGHFILEQISRLWYFLDEEDKSLPIIYISSKPLEGNFLEFFELLGIDISRLVWVNEITKFNEIIVPEISMVAMNYFTKEYREIYNQVSKNVEPFGKEYEKVFYTTRNFYMSKSKDWGEIEKIEKFFGENGYKIISPEQKTLKEQIAIMKSCKEFVSVSGTLPHNLLFANNDIKPIILNKSCILNWQQTLIDQVKKIKPLYIDTHLSFLPAHLWTGPFYHYVSDNLKKFAKDNNMSNIESDDEVFSEFVKKYVDYYRFYNKNTLDKSCEKYENYYLSKIEGYFWYKLIIRLRLFGKLYPFFKFLVRKERTKIILKSYINV